MKNKELYFLGESYGKLKLDKINNKIFILASNKVFVNNINKVFDEISEKCELVVEDNFEKAMLLINYIKFDIFIVEDISDNNNILFSNSGSYKFVQYVRQNTIYFLTPVFFFSNTTDGFLDFYSDLNCYACYEKAFAKEALTQKIKNTLLRLNFTNQNNIAYSNNGIFKSFNISEFIYVEIRNRTAYIKTTKDTIEVKYLSMQEILSDLALANIIRIRRNIVVNADCIKYYDCSNGIIELFTGDYLEVGRNYKNDVLEYYGIFRN